MPRKICHVVEGNYVEHFADVSFFFSLEHFLDIFPLLGINDIFPFVRARGASFR